MTSIVIALGAALVALAVRCAAADVALELARIRHELEAGRHARDELTDVEKALAALPYGEADR